MREIVVVALMALSTAAVAEIRPWAPPRTPSGAPDLEGVWTNASVTKLTRPRSLAKLVVSPAEAEAIAKANPTVRGLTLDAAPTDPNQGAPVKGGDTSRGFNAFWLEPGRTLAKVKGEYRTSWIADPADGQLPLSAEGRRRVGEADAFFDASQQKPAGPEELEPWDRCLISSRGSGGPGMLNNIYNSNYQIVQTSDAVAIVVEMIHDVRTIPLFHSMAEAQAAHRPADIQPWLGDSVGWWEGDTLVVETTHVNREQGRAGPLYLTPKGRVTERLRRVAPDEIAYEFTVEDPAYYSRPWRAEMTLTPNKGRLYEYACHEGNYAMANLLRGARMADDAGKTVAQNAKPAP